MSEKTKDISKFELFERLQREYICATFRKLIYFKPNDKDYWKKICNYKKEKIESISNELELPSLFDNEKLRLQYIKEFKNEGGIPIFIYKDDNSDEHLKITDIQNYYKKGSEVKEAFTNNVGVIIDDADVLKGEVIVQYIQEGRKVIHKLEQVVRMV